MEEDVPAGNGIQQSAGMPQVKQMLLGRNEVLNQLFHRTYSKLMRGESLGDGLSGDRADAGADAAEPAVEASRAQRNVARVGEPA